MAPPAFGAELDGGCGSNGVTWNVPVCWSFLKHDQLSGPVCQGTAAGRHRSRRNANETRPIPPVPSGAERVRATLATTILQAIRWLQVHSREVTSLEPHPPISPPAGARILHRRGGPAVVAGMIGMAGVPEEQFCRFESRARDCRIQPLAGVTAVLFGLERC